MPNIYSAHVLLMQAYHGRLQDGLVSSEQARSSVPAGRLGRLQNLSDAPITLLVGSMALAKMYMIHHILQVVIETLKCRLSPHSFDEICTAAIERDVTVLRLLCTVCAGEARTNLRWVSRREFLGRGGIRTGWFVWRATAPQEATAGSLSAPCF